VGDFQTLFNVSVGAVGILAGFILNVLWQALKDLQQVDSQLASKVSSIEILVAGQYIKRDLFDAKVDALFTKLDQMESKFDLKLDRALDHRNPK
jgi:hypothetical protein